MKLVDFAFKKIANKEKDIEVRLLDEKRQLINIGDTINFKNIDTGEFLKVIVVNLMSFNNFKEMFEKIELKRMGLKETDTYLIMNNFYTTEDRMKYKALGIQIELVE